MLTTTHRLIVPVVMALAAAAAGALVFGGAAAAQQDLPPGLEDAIRANVEARGEEYAGDCQEATLEEDVGKWCSHVQLLDGQAIVSLGPTFSEFVAEVIFTEQDGTWTGRENGRLDGPPTVPDTGDGAAAAAGGNGGMLAALIASAAGIAAIATGARLRRSTASERVR